MELILLLMLFPNLVSIIPRSSNTTVLGIDNMKTMKNNLKHYIVKFFVLMFLRICWMTFIYHDISFAM